MATEAPASHQSKRVPSEVAESPGAPCQTSTRELLGAWPGPTPPVQPTQLAGQNTTRCLALR